MATPAPQGAAGRVIANPAYILAFAVNAAAAALGVYQWWNAARDGVELHPNVYDVDNAGFTRLGQGGFTGVILFIVLGAGISALLSFVARPRGRALIALCLSATLAAAAGQLWIW